MPYYAWIYYWSPSYSTLPVRGAYCSYLADTAPSDKSGEGCARPCPSYGKYPVYGVAIGP